MLATTNLLGLGVLLIIVIAALVLSHIDVNGRKK